MQLHTLYNLLYQQFGPQHWWPAESPFEVIVGAILTQNTNWRNVELAIANLRQAGALEIRALQELPRPELEALIRPSGFFRQKALRLHRLTLLLHDAFQGDLQQLFALPLPELRKLLLRQHGIGPETADSILLYAAGKPSFVVDAYTHRILQRLGLQTGPSDYEQTRNLFMNALPHDPQLFNEFHALLVRLAKEFCRKREPLCRGCPLLARCRHGLSVAGD